ncbi:MAG TPA: VOC family protein [Acidimicrobiales bacterium]|nr:VOC family protein [Acidimicrobiales bacterium]
MSPSSTDNTPSPDTPGDDHGGYHSVNQFLVVDGAEEAMRFLGAVFGATEQERITRPDGSIGHAEVRLGDSVVMLTEASPSLTARPATSYVFVPDVDAAFARAIEHGATVRSAPADQFYGNREAGVYDPWGNLWWMATVIEVVAPGELQARFDAESSPAG